MKVNSIYYVWFGLVWFGLVWCESARLIKKSAQIYLRTVMTAFNKVFIVTPNVNDFAMLQESPLEISLQVTASKLSNSMESLLKPVGKVLILNG